MDDHATSCSFLLFGPSELSLDFEAVKRAADLVRLSTCGRITANGLDSYGLPEQSSGAVRRSGKRPPRERIGRRSDGKGGPDHFALASHMSVRVRVRSDEPTNPVCVYA